MKRILDSSAASQLVYHEHDDKITIAQSTDVSAALARNEQLRRAGMTKTKDGDHFAASIPLDLLQEWAQKRGTSWEVVAGDDRMLDQFLAEHSKCRIYEGKI